MELQLGGYQEAPAAAAPAEEAPKAEQKKNTKDDTIEKAANELKSIADMMNVKKEDKKEDKKEKKMEEVKETVTENTAAQAPDNADGNSAAYGAASALEGEPMDENAVITACMTVKGDVQSRGSVEIQGVVEGNVTVLGKLNVSGKLNGDAKAAEVFADGAQISGQINADGTAKIGKESVIIGNIYATSAVIAGAVKGDIDVHGPVILDSTAIVMGNIKSKSVQINNGAAIEGMCSQCYADSSPSSFFDKFLK
ncbi:MAG: polymer-forming cytoskeletal protein [Lachnospiraceae bacterium]|nr:polymer-forming cytoskeletal protein [Lachnospiraceae bacterium]